MEGKVWQIRYNNEENTGIATLGAFLQVVTDIKESEIQQPSRHDFTDLILRSYSGSTNVTYVFNHNCFNTILNMSLFCIHII